MHVANSRVDIRFRRLPEGTTEYEVLDVRGNVRIARRPNPWLLTTGWAEDICEAVSGF